MKTVKQNLRFSKSIKQFFLLYTFCYTITVTPKPYPRSATCIYFFLINNFYFIFFLTFTVTPNPYSRLVALFIHFNYLYF